MTNKIIIFILVSWTLTSCGPRSGVSHENDNAVCGVTEEDYKPTPANTESQISGRDLFKNFCSECHMIDKEVKDGDMLKGVCDRIPKGEWFKYYIQNSDSLKKSEDPYSLKIDHDNQSDYEHNFKKLSDKEIQDIYNYLRLW